MIKYHVGDTFTDASQLRATTFGRSMDAFHQFLSTAGVAAGLLNGTLTDGFSIRLEAEQAANYLMQGFVKHQILCAYNSAGTAEGRFRREVQRTLDVHVPTGPCRERRRVCARTAA